MVGSEYVGAIIGKQGQTIKNITSQSRARFVACVCVIPLCDEIIASFIPVSVYN